VKLKNHPYVSVVNLENICVKPEKILPEGLLFVAELLYTTALLTGPDPLGTFILSLSNMALSCATDALLP
jgi:hypothetical protein